MDAGHFENRQAHFMTVSVKGPRESLSKNRTNTARFDRFRCDGASGGTAEVTSGHDDVAVLDLFGKFGIQRFEYVFRHFGETLPDDVSGSDLVRGNVVTEFPAVPFDYHGRNFTSPVNCTGSRVFCSAEPTDHPTVHEAYHESSLFLGSTRNHQRWTLRLFRPGARGETETFGRRIHRA